MAEVVVFMAVAEAEDSMVGAADFTEADFPAVDTAEAVSQAADSMVGDIAGAAFQVEATVVAVLAAVVMDSKEVAASAERAAASAVCAAETPAIMPGPPKDAAFATLLPDGTRSSADRMRVA